MDSGRPPLVVGISGSSGAAYGARLVEVLVEHLSVPVHLVMSRGARATLAYETDHDPARLEALATVTYDEADVGAAIASGTFRTAGMVVAPCSIKTVAGIANCFSTNLLLRAADVTLKERRTLVLVVRETPLHLGHLRLMTAVTEAGAVVLPPVPGFYTRPSTIEDVVDHTVTKILDQFDLDAELIERWHGLGGEQ